MSLFLLFLSGVLLLTGCVSDEPEVFLFSEKNNAYTLTCKVKDDIVIRLKANPTTGYLWKSAAIPDMTVVRLVEERYVNPENKKGLVGAPGIREFRYHTVGGGEAAIRLEYRRPWEKDTPPAQVFQIRLRVREKEKSKLFNDDYIAPRRGSKGQVEPLSGGNLR